MAKPTRSDDWGFPRWRPYGAKGREAPVRLCDREGCNQPATGRRPRHPIALSAGCSASAHAAEYNKNWNYFAGLTAEEAARRRRGRKRCLSVSEQRAWAWGRPGDGIEAATRCARSTRSSWKPMPTSRRSAPPIAGWPRSIILIGTRATRKRPSASSSPGGLRGPASGRGAEDRGEGI